MRNDTARWDAPSVGAWQVQGHGVAIRSLSLPRQTLISGVEVLGDQAPYVGWPEIAEGARYTVALRRDRVLVVGGSAHTEGWDAATAQATSDMSSGYGVFEIKGSRTLDLLKRGTDIDLAAPSKSSARLFAGLGVILYRYGAEDCVRVHVPAAHTQALMQTFEAMLAEMG